MMGSDRRIGVALIVAAAIALLAITGTSGRGIAGHAVALPWSTPPAVGACLTMPDVTAANQDPVQVPCNRLHTAEVVRSWRKGQQPAQDVDPCSGMSVTWMSNPSLDWIQPPPSVLSRYVNGGDPLGWVACIQGPVTAGSEILPLQYTGTLAAGPDGRPAARIGTCYRDPAQQVDCHRPHFFELIGVFIAQNPDSRPLSSCGAYARAQVGPAAFVDNSGLKAIVGQDQSPQMMSTIGGTSAAWLSSSTCLVMSAVPGRELVGSVIGLGDRPIPYG